MTSSYAISLTFGDVAENHRGMQRIGKLSACGFQLSDLQKIKTRMEEHGAVCELTTLMDDAYFLHIANGVNALGVNPNELMSEQMSLNKDTKAFMYGRVVNKHARYNLCFGETHQEPDYEAKKGRIYAFSEVPLLSLLRNELQMLTDTDSLQVEGNYYYDTAKCGIGYHGDTERRKVIAVRLGHCIPLCFQKYHQNEPVEEPIVFHNLNHGDIYIMSEKATGFDWKSKSKYTLRHAAGCSKFTGV